MDIIAHLAEPGDVVRLYCAVQGVDVKRPASRKPVTSGLSFRVVA
jgi:hypothetical protein